MMRAQTTSDPDKVRLMGLALREAEKCTPVPTAFCVGAVITYRNQPVSTGYSRQLEGNTHAEQCALERIERTRPELLLKTPGDGVDPELAIFTTMAPCSDRLSGNVPCADRILHSPIGHIYVGVREPDTFVKDNSAEAKLLHSGRTYTYVQGLEDKCLAVANRGHKTLK